MHVVRLTSAASDDVVEFLGYYREEGGDALAERCHDAFVSALHAVARRPFSVPSFMGSPFRRRRLPQFPYGILFRIEDDEVVVVAVGHLARGPDFWRQRIDS